MTDPLKHFTISWGETRPRFETLPCLLARAWADGRFELLNPRWDALGFARDDLAGRYLSELVALPGSAARKAMQSLLSEEGLLEFGLRSKDGRVVRLRWHREYDDFTSSMFIVGDELPAPRTRPARRRVEGAVPLAGLSAT